MKKDLMIIDWIRKNKDILKIKAIEKNSGIPKDTIQKAIDGKRRFPEKWDNSLKEYFKEIIDSLKIDI